MSDRASGVMGGTETGFASEAVDPAYRASSPRSENRPDCEYEYECHEGTDHQDPPKSVCLGHSSFCSFSSTRSRNSAGVMSCRARRVMAFSARCS